MGKHAFDQLSTVIAASQDQRRSLHLDEPHTSCRCVREYPDGEARRDHLDDLANFLDGTRGSPRLR